MPLLGSKEASLKRQSLSPTARMKIGENSRGIRTQPSERSDIIVSIVALIVAFRPELFFSTISIFGITHSGSENSPIYLAFIATSSATLYLLVIQRVISARLLSIRDLFILLLPAIIIAIFLFDVAFYRTQTTSYDHFMLTVVFASPAAVAGMVFAGKDVRAKHAYGLEPIMLVMSIGLIFSAIDTIQGASIDRGIGGASYQTASYIGALAFNLNLFYILQGRAGDRPNYTRLKSYNIFCWLLLPAQAFAVLLNGGRGGFVLVVVGAIVQAFLSVRSKHSLRSVGNLTILSIVLTVSSFLVLPRLLARADLARSIGRIFSYLGEDGINWDGTSGRDVVYTRALAAIEDSPVFGYGLFSWGTSSYPHNIFLEWLLNGGVVYLLLATVVVVSMIFRGIRFARLDQTVAIVCLVGLYPVVYLQFSGSYLTTGSFWFVLAFLFCLNREPQLLR